MLDAYLEIFYATCIQFVPVIIPVLGIYLVVMFAGDLLLGRR